VGEIRALAKDAVSQRQIAERLDPPIHRRTVARALASETPPRYVRALTATVKLEIPAS
jgi:hypothetical protein